MKTLISFVLLILALNIYSQDVHFKMYVETNKAKCFADLLDEAGFEYMEKYQVIFNEKEDYIIIGRYNSPDLELDSEAARYHWSVFSKKTLLGFLNWKDKSKIQLFRKSKT